ncbi:DNA-processing protein DprA [Salinibacterium sp. TMP30]|uniref:DNA-processing protein DprA n=1 Tax=Salinibacterium sp. TMP30 TaxID=3138237 RepID=UPI003139E914
MTTTTSSILDSFHQQHHNLTLDTLARVALSSMSEPGDSDIGQLVASLGAEGAVRALLDAEDTTIDAEMHEWAHTKFSAGLIELAFRSAARFGATLITPEHPHWPTRMNDLGIHAPFALWVRGDSEILIDDKTTAIVGARAATGYGEHITMEIGAGLVERGHTIASGAAYGIDGMAHRGALASGGRTMAYLSGGVDRFYSSGHDALLGRIVERRVVVSELPCGAMPTRWRFLQRNRLIAANSATVVVTEAGWRSGSLNTASHAAALGRAVGAVPGPVTSAASAGCHRLIRENRATLITNTKEAATL